MESLPLLFSEGADTLHTFPVVLLLPAEFLRFMQLSDMFINCIHGTKVRELNQTVENIFLENPYS